MRTNVAAALLCAANFFFTVSFADGDIALEKLSTNDLEKIKQTAIVYLETKKPLNWEIHLAELRRGAVFDFEHEQRIGRWMVESGADSVTLIRDADVAPEVRRFGLVLVKKADGYEVVSEFWERESFR